MYEKDKSKRIVSLRTTFVDHFKDESIRSKCRTENIKKNISKR
jgi:hypothetical protein